MHRRRSRAVKGDVSVAIEAVGGKAIHVVVVWTAFVPRMGRLIR